MDTIVPTLLVDLIYRVYRVRIGGAAGGVEHIQWRNHLRPLGGIGIHKGLKILRLQWLAGSSPAEATTNRLPYGRLKMYRKLFAPMQTHQITIKIRACELLSGILNLTSICAIDFIT